MKPESYLRKTNQTISLGIPIELIEVSDTSIRFDNTHDASDFLGIHRNTISVYVRQKTKIIKSKKTGKTYLIRKATT